MANDRHRRILVFEDNEIIGPWLCAKLAMLGWQPTLVSAVHSLNGAIDAQADVFCPGDSRHESTTKAAAIRWSDYCLAFVDGHLSGSTHNWPDFYNHLNAHGIKWLGISSNHRVNEEMISCGATDGTIDKVDSPDLLSKHGLSPNNE